MNIKQINVGLNLFTIFNVLLFLIVLLPIWEKAFTIAGMKQYNLKIKFSFPNEREEIVLAHPTAMDFDEQNNIYICDYKLNSILKYSKEGKFISQIGHKGQGPGEFNGQHVFCYNNGRLFVIDQGNRRIQIFDKEGQYLSSFMTPNIAEAIAHKDGKIYSYLAIGPDVGRNSALISIIDDNDGKKLGQFGEYIEFVNKRINWMGSSCLLKIYNDKLYVLFRYYPKLNIYDLDGKIINSYNFEKVNYKKLISDNYNVKPIIKGGATIISLRFLFNAFDINSEGIFLGLYADDIIIDQFNFEGEFLRRFRLSHSGDPFYLADFKVFKINSNFYEFYILKAEERPEVVVCEAKLD